MLTKNLKPICDDDIDHNHSGNEPFQAVLQARLGRRSILRGAIGSAATAVFGGLAVSACGGGNDVEPAALPTVKPLDKLSFAAVGKSLADRVVVPAGYTASVIYALGDPLTASTSAFKNDGSDGDFDNRAGDHHDGMEFFGLSASGQPDLTSSTRGVLVMNHEATSHANSERASAFVHVNGGTNSLPRPAAEVDREVPLHGVSVVEVAKTGASFAYVKESAFNRRITPLTPVVLSGVAAGSGLMKTKYAADGRLARGTLNNCGTGNTPWGTTLTGEENFAGYFTRSATDDTARANDKSVTALKRYGRAQGLASRHGWETGGSEDKYARWNISKIGASADGADDYRNELNTFGYLVEIDPYSKTAAVKKRTGLGRFAHESAAFSKLVEGKPLAVYMGDDSRGEYIYKWVSTANWSVADAKPTDRMATGDKYLDAGKLYTAKFNADGSGQWIELALSNTAIATSATYAFADQADVVVNARLAADAVGATKMDRPEWCASHPTTGEVYFTLTNNSARTLATVDAANPRFYEDIKGAATKQVGNVNGHIIRVADTGGDAAAISFKWDVYLFASEAGADASMVNLSSLTEDQDMSSPDGLWFSRATGLCWIQTDDGAFTDKSNCMMLAGIPGTVGDGAKKTLAYTGKSVDTFVGKTPTADTLKRFLVGPIDCELTGCTETPDGRALFVNIQHPGETITSANVADPAKFVSHWPGNAGYGAGGATARPRSATIVITKNDGGVIGS